MDESEGIEGLRGVENGCAAEVEVAAGAPSWLPREGPLGAEVAVVEANRLAELEETCHR